MTAFSRLLTISYFTGDEIIRTNKRNEEDTKETRPRIPSHTTSTIAEEAVDQLQASEKLIAGNWDYSKNVYFYNF